mmetsp:Transcript_27526/g.70089  ORF Transcript_27526/g.70089 Transcript_27526/m.70089 type:complete len:81 (-) Transcript_27526:3821-4063(-)
MMIFVVFVFETLTLQPPTSRIPLLRHAATKNTHTACQFRPTQKQAQHLTSWTMHPEPLRQPGAEPNPPSSLAGTAHGRLR